MNLAFSTLACTDWSWEHIVQEAARLGYGAIELRGVENEMFVPRARPFQPDQLEQSLSLLKQYGLRICCVNTSCRFDQAELIPQFLEEGKAYIELAVKVESPYIRVFGDKLPAGIPREKTIHRLASSLETLGRYAEKHGKIVLLESHGDFNTPGIILEVLSKTTCPSLGVLWDIDHTYTHGNEDIRYTFEALRKYIKHIHIKDSLGRGKQAKLCMIGEGEVPIDECVHTLLDYGYDGWISLEWEKKWHPELADASIALSRYVEYMTALWRRLTTAAIN